MHHHAHQLAWQDMISYLYPATRDLWQGWAYTHMCCLSDALAPGDCRWYFLKRVYPRQGGRDVLVAPAFLRRWVANWGIGAPPVREVTMHPSAPGFRPFTGRGRRL